MSPTTPPTTLRTSEPKVAQLVTVELETKGEWCRLRAFGAPLRGVRKLHEWRFTQVTLSADLLNEIGATVDALTLGSVLSVVGSQGQLSFELLEAVGQLRERLSE